MGRTNNTNPQQHQSHTPRPARWRDITPHPAWERQKYISCIILRQEMEDEKLDETTGEGAMLSFSWAIRKTKLHQTLCDLGLEPKNSSSSTTHSAQLQTQQHTQPTQHSQHPQQQQQQQPQHVRRQPPQHVRHITCFLYPSVKKQERKRKHNKLRKVDVEGGHDLDHGNIVKVVRERIRVVFIAPTEDRLRKEQQRLRWLRLLEDTNTTTILEQARHVVNNPSAATSHPTRSTNNLSETSIDTHADSFVSLSDIQQHQGTRVMGEAEGVQQKATDQEEEEVDKKLQFEPQKRAALLSSILQQSSVLSDAAYSHLLLHDRTFSQRILSQLTSPRGFFRTLDIHTLTAIKAQFGESVGLYFAFFAFYMRWLWVPSVIGTCMFLFCSSLSTPYSCAIFGGLFDGVVAANQTVVTNTTQTGGMGNSISMGNNTCFSVSLGGDAASSSRGPTICELLIILFTIFISAWAGVFVTFWKRECVALCHLWGIPLEEDKVMVFRDEFKQWWERKKKQQNEEGRLTGSASRAGFWSLGSIKNFQSGARGRRVRTSSLTLRQPGSVVATEDPQSKDDLLVELKNAVDPWRKVWMFITILLLILQLIGLSIIILGLYIMFIVCYNLKLYCMCSFLASTTANSQDLGWFPNATMPDIEIPAKCFTGQFDIFGNRSFNIYDVGLYGAAIFWGIMIEWLNWKVFYSIALWLTKCENWATVGEHQRALVHKTFTFYFVDGMLWYLILAFGQIPMGDRLWLLLWSLWDPSYHPTANDHVPQEAFKQVFPYYIMLYLLISQILVLWWEWGFTTWWCHSIRSKYQLLIGTRTSPPVHPQTSVLQKFWNYLRCCCCCCCCCGSAKQSRDRADTKSVELAPYQKLQEEESNAAETSKRSGTNNATPSRSVFVHNKPEHGNDDHHVQITPPPNADIVEALVQSELEPYDPFFDYADIVLQFGYVAIFSVIWTPAAAACLFNNWFELRVDLAKCCKLYQRPTPLRQSGIGAWLRCLEFQAWICVALNCLLLTVATSHADWLLEPVARAFGLANLYTCDQGNAAAGFDGYTNINTGSGGILPTGMVVRLLLAFCLEHTIFVLMYLMEGAVDLMPRWVWAELNDTDHSAKMWLRDLIANNDEGGRTLLGRQRSSSLGEVVEGSSGDEAARSTITEYQNEWDPAVIAAAVSVATPPPRATRKQGNNADTSLTRSSTLNKLSFQPDKDESSMPPVLSSRSPSATVIERTQQQQQAHTDTIDDLDMEPVIADDNPLHPLPQTLRRNSFSGRKSGELAQQQHHNHAQPNIYHATVVATSTRNMTARQHQRYHQQHPQTPVADDSGNRRPATGQRRLKMIRSKVVLPAGTRAATVAFRVLSLERWEGMERPDLTHARFTSPCATMDILPFSKTSETPGGVLRFPASAVTRPGVRVFWMVELRELRIRFSGDAGDGGGAADGGGVVEGKYVLTVDGETETVEFVLELEIEETKKWWRCAVL